MSRLTSALGTSKKKVIYLLPTGSLRYRNCTHPTRYHSGSEFSKTPLYAYITNDQVHLVKVQTPVLFKVFTPALLTALEIYE